VLEIVVVVGLLIVMIIGVTPRFASAHESALREGLQLQVEMINRQIEQFRLDHDDATPVLGGAESSGWGPLVEGGYLRQPPVNGLLQSSAVYATTTTPKSLLGDEPTKSQMEIGWFYHEVEGRVIANGFDHLNGAFFDEPGYVRHQFAW
jgi:type II secretory pathway pseudopilin PulG